MKPRHIPVRTCAGCRQERSKREMVRVVRSVDGSVAIDPTGKLNGRGTYMCPTDECWDRAIRSGSLARALKITLEPSDRARLEAARPQFAVPATAPVIGVEQ